MPVIGRWVSGSSAKKAIATPVLPTGTYVYGGALLDSALAGRDVKATAAPVAPRRKSARACGSVRSVLSLTRTVLFPARQEPTIHWVRARSSSGMPSPATSCAPDAHEPGTGAKRTGTTVRWLHAHCS